MLEIEKDVFQLFPINIFIDNDFLTIEGCDIIAKILESLNHDNHKHSLLQGDATSSFRIKSHILDVISSQSLPFRELKDKIQEKIDYFTNVSGISRPILTNSWFNIQNENSRLLPHAHGDAVVSGALYINVDENSSPLDFINPNYSILGYPSSYDKCISSVKPKKGTLVLFPSYLVHGNWYGENKTKGRIVISFNASHMHV